MDYTNIDQLPLVLSVTQLAKILNIGKNTAYGLVRSGCIKSTRCGNQIRIYKSALIEFLTT